MMEVGAGLVCYVAALMCLAGSGACRARGRDVVALWLEGATGVWVLALLTCFLWAVKLPMPA